MITSNLPNCTEEVYTGVTAFAWKARYANHKTSFNLRKYINSSELFKEVWGIKDKGGEPTIKWRIIKHRAPYNPVAKRCNLCLSEKLYILEYEGTNLLNKRDELISKCRHRNKYTLLHQMTNVNYCYFLIAQHCSGYHCIAILLLTYFVFDVH